MVASLQRHQGAFKLEKATSVKAVGIAPQADSRPTQASHRALLGSFGPGKRWKETPGSLLGVFPHTTRASSYSLPQNRLVLARRFTDLRDSNTDV